MLPLGQVLQYIPYLTSGMSIKPGLPVGVPECPGLEGCHQLGWDIVVMGHDVLGKMAEVPIGKGLLRICFRLRQDLHPDPPVVTVAGVRSKLLPEDNVRAYAS